MDNKTKEIVELEEAARRIRESTAKLPVVKIGFGCIVK